MMRFVGKRKGLIISLLVLIGAIIFAYHNLITEIGITNHIDPLNFFTSLKMGEIYNQWFQTWDSSHLLGGAQAGFGSVLSSPLYFLMAKLHAVPSPSIYVLLLLLLSGISCYLLVYYYTSNVYSSTVAGIFYATCWVLEGMIGQMPLLLGYALFPILFLLFDRALEKGRFKDIVFFSLFAFIFVTSAHMHNIYIAVLFLALFALVRPFLSREGGLATRVTKTAKVSLISLALLLGLLSYALIPWIFGATPSFLARSYVIEDVAHATNQLMMTFPLTVGPYTLAHTTGWFLLAMIIVALAFSALLFRRDRYTIFFTAVALITIFWAKGPHSPFASLFNWLWNNFPGFSAERGSATPLMLTSLCYAFLLGVSIKYIPMKLKSLFQIKFPQAQTLLSVSLVCIVLTVNFLSVKPFFSYNIMRGFDPNQYPQYVEAKAGYDLIASQDDDIYSMLLIYQRDMILDENVTDPVSGDPYYLALNPIAWLFPEAGQPILAFPEIWTDLRLSGLSRFVNSQIDEPSVTDFTGVLGSGNVKYIVIDKLKAGNYIEFFQRQDNCTLIYEGETLVIFENGNALPHVYGALISGELVGGLNSFSALQLIPNFSFSNINLLPSSSQNDNMDFLILYNADSDDFVMLSALESEGGVQKLDIEDYAKMLWWRRISEEELQNWVISDWWYAEGAFVFDQFHIRTGGQNSVEVPFSVDESGDYQMWLRIAFAPGRGQLDILIDGSNVLSLTPEMEFNYGFKFVKVPLCLEEGEHALELRNDGSGFNDVDEVFLIESAALDSLFSTAAERIPEAIYYQEGEKLFALEELGNWTIYDYTGLARVVADDEQSQFWVVAAPKLVSISDSSSVKKHGSNSLEIMVSGEKKPWTTLSHTFIESQDWSDKDNLCFYFYGNNTSYSFGLIALTGEGGEKKAEFDWTDNFVGWKCFTFPLAERPEADWSQVKGLRFGIHQTTASGTWYFDNLGVVKRAVSPTTVIKSADDASQTSVDFRALREGDYMIAIRALAGTQQEIVQHVPYIFIADDEQSQFWKVAAPELVSISDSSSVKKHGSNSLEIVVSGEKKPWTTLSHTFTESQDWSGKDNLCFYFYGNNTGYSFGLIALTGEGGEKRAEFDWTDNFVGWKCFTFPLAEQSGADWSQVKELRFGIHQTTASGTWYFDYLTVGKMETIMAGTSPEDTELQVAIDGSSKTIGGFSDQFGWYEVGPFHLDTQPQTIELTNQGTVWIDKVVIYPYGSQSSLDGLFNRDNNISLSYAKLSPTKYQVHVNTDRPFWLVFSEIYHPLWQAQVDGESMDSVQTYLGFNSFYVTKVGEYDLVLEFKGQQYMNYGAIVSFLTLGLMVSGVVFTEIRARKRRRGKGGNMISGTGEGNQAPPLSIRRLKLAEIKKTRKLYNSLSEQERKWINFSMLGGGGPKLRFSAKAFSKRVHFTLAHLALMIATYSKLDSVLIRLFGKGYIPIVALSDGKIVGLAILWIGSRQSDGGYAARLSAIAVKEDSRSLGIATRLMESLIEFAESSGVIRIDLLVHADNEKARRLYTKVGFNLIKVSNGILKMRRDIKTSD